MNATEDMREFEGLLDYLKRTRGFDFTGYKRSSLIRRVRKRMQMISVDQFTDYIDRLEVNPDEFKQLFNTILINVTDFFRDTDAWDYLAQETVPRIVSAHPDGPIRIWDAGCSSGEEACTIAILLAEAMQADAFRERVKIYATDADEEALKHAREATYTSKAVQNIPPALLEKYFERSSNGHYIFQKDLRRAIIYGRHDLVQDAPISRVDLIVCRNTLMYFNTQAQARILNNFHFGLHPDGFLFLGKSEMLLTHGNLFQPGELKQRIFTKVVQNAGRERLANFAPQSGNETVSALPNHLRLRDSAADANPVAQIVVTLKGHLITANLAARNMFHLLTRDIGKPLQDLEVSYRPVELRSRIETAYAERRPSILRDVIWIMNGETHYLDIQIFPLFLPDGDLQGASITFTDVTHFRNLQAALGSSKQELETAYEELQSAIEELETTNEELQSTNEELETTNEELQSTNEELETMNEELQSTNEELETINDELQQRTDELHQINGFLQAILTNLHTGVIVVDDDLRIQVWNSRSEDLWGLRADEVQAQHLLNLDIGLPVDQLKPMLRSCINDGAGEQAVMVEAMNRRGKPVRCHIKCVPLKRRKEETGGADGGGGAILLVDVQDSER